jgi:hypothetical protein
MSLEASSFSLFKLFRRGYENKNSWPKKPRRNKAGGAQEAVVALSTVSETLSKPIIGNIMDKEISYPA